MAFRIALYELRKLIENGLTQPDFEATRDYLMKNVYLMTATQDQQLGYALDSRWYGIPEYTGYMREQLAKLTLADVNAAIRRHLSGKDLQVVIVTKDAKQLARVARERHGARDPLRGAEAEGGRRGGPADRGDEARDHARGDPHDPRRRGVREVAAGWRRHAVAVGQSRDRRDDPRVRRGLGRRGRGDPRPPRRGRTSPGSAPSSPSAPLRCGARAACCASGATRSRG